MPILLLPLLVSGNVNYVHIAVIKLIFICNVIGMHVLEIILVKVCCYCLLALCLAMSNSQLVKPRVFSRNSLGFEKR